MITHACNCVYGGDKGWVLLSTRSNIFPESSRVSSFTILTSPNSPTISISLLFRSCLLVCCTQILQSMSGRFRSPARMTDGGILQLRYRMERDSCKASRDVVSFGGLQ